LSTASLATPRWCSRSLLSPQVSFLAAACSPFGEVFSDRGINFGRASRGARTSVWTEGALLAVGADTGEEGPCLEVNDYFRAMLNACTTTYIVLFASDRLINVGDREDKLLKKWHSLWLHHKVI